MTVMMVTDSCLIEWRQWRRLMVAAFVLLVVEGDGGYMVLQDGGVRNNY